MIGYIDHVVVYLHTHWVSYAIGALLLIATFAAIAAIVEGNQTPSIPYIPSKSDKEEE